MSVKEISPGKNVVVVYIKKNGKMYRRQKTVNGASSKAKIQEGELRAELRNHIVKLESNDGMTAKTFSDIIDFYELTEDYPVRMGCYAERLRGECGEFPVVSLASRLPKYFGKIKTNMSDAAKNRLRSIGNIICMHALRNSLIDENPFKNVRRWKEERRNRVLTVDEFDTLRAAIEDISPWLIPAFMFSTRIPIRRGDLRAVKASIFSREEMTVSFVAGKSKVVQAAPVPPGMDGYFSKIPSGAKYLFARDPQHKLPLGDFSRYWYAALKQAGIPKGSVRWHDLRHHACTWLHKQGFRTDIIQTVGGWKTRKMVEYYHSADAQDAAESARATLNKNEQAGK